ncbi:8-amino-7-oxononanoate synthase [Histoplasma capsulatum var. duboisii H88]|uniref:8-amino-7-oxononanoate synthase n=2 Tax=Ajellomyces capsulatus TaxID=5037 RepID=F0UTU8_AJEC8|nr:8-amino-7-oxononanoate synthase [Histoplasma capsulatum H143]EGC49325.1 8-amino-7-oxononanoate synthase [Histoplasma capsulatum var. duboisii H88]QSS57846.1 8-amino-7-oxononanoate synthase [Histoplasma capsulatum var. duboisii H88]
MDSSGALLRAFQSCLDQREVKGRRRHLQVPPSGGVDFSSNDFLSLSTSTTLRSHLLQSLAREPPSHSFASKGSRLLDGNSAYTENLERFITAFHNAESGLLFNSGYDANLSIFSCVPQPGDVVIHDELIHASVHDGVKLSRASRKISFKHNSVDDFFRIAQSVVQGDPLVASGERSVFVAVESLYSMQGDFAPIAELLAVIKTVFPRGNAYMIVDEAHTTGVFGPRGAGLVQELGVEGHVFIRVHTFGKALASHGAIVLCSHLTREYLINYARPIIYSTALGLPSLASTRVAYELMNDGATESLQSQLHDLVKYMATRLKSLQPADPAILTIHHQDRSPIFSLQTSMPRELASFLQAEGQIVRAIMPPTVPVGTERVRVCLHARNTFEEIDCLTTLIKEWIEQQRPRRTYRL